MDTFDAIYARRSVKGYDASHVMPAADEAKLFDAVCQSPTSFNMQNWRIVVIRDPQARAQVKAAAWGQEQVSDASLLLALCADVKAWEKDPARYWQTAPEQTRGMIVNMIDAFYRGKDQLQRDEAMRSAGIASQTLMLAAKALGYDSCPMIGFDPDAVAKIINLPEDHVIGMLLAIGKPSRPAQEKGGYLGRDILILEERFPG